MKGVGATLVIKSSFLAGRSSPFLKSTVPLAQFSNQASKSNLSGMIGMPGSLSANLIIAEIRKTAWLRIAKAVSCFIRS